MESEDQSGKPTLPVVTIFCLGTFKALVDGEEIADPPGSAGWVLRYLVTCRGRPVSHHELAIVLGAADDSPADGVAVGEAWQDLRRALHHTPFASEALRLLARYDGYILQAENAIVDAEQFETLCERGQQLDQRGRRQEARACYARAITLYRGPFLPRVSQRWAALRRESLEDQYALALRRLAEETLASGDFAACVHYCRELLKQSSSGPKPHVNQRTV